MKRDTPLVQFFYNCLNRYILPLLDRYHVTPDQLTVTGLLLSGVAGLIFIWHPGLGAAMLLAGGLFDSLDGLVARARGSASKAGAFLDSVLDRYGELLVLAGIWGYMYRTDQPVVLATLAILFTLAGSLLVSYTRARGEGLGVSCTSGLFQRPERILLLALAGFMETLLPGRALLGMTLLLAILTNSTAVGRLLAILHQLRQAATEQG
ncbi:CDP-alcohol phosphatidyltransferase family protein [Desulfolithobacter sp.]